MKLLVIICEILCLGDGNHVKNVILKRIMSENCQNFKNYQTLLRKFRERFAILARVLYRFEKLNQKNDKKNYKTRASVILYLNFFR